MQHHKNFIFTKLFHHSFLSFFSTPKMPLPTLFSSHSLLSIIIIIIMIFRFQLSLQQEQEPRLDPTEQESLYKVLHSLNPSTPWRSLFPDDLCLYPPHGVVCDLFPQTPTNDTSLNQTTHIVELNFGYVSDFTPNPSCSQNATFNTLLFSSFAHLRKLFFYNCFNQTTTTTTQNDTFSFPLPSTLEELVFIENPSLVAPSRDIIGNLTNLKRLILIRNGFYGEIPSTIGEFSNLEEVTLSGNKLTGEVPESFGNLKKLKVLDLSHNDFEGCVPKSIGNCTELLKLDFSYNRFRCEIPGNLGQLKRLEFLDFSYNRFGNFGVPLFLKEVTSLKEVYLSGNLLSGVIPEIWESLGGLVKIGFSEMGLIGKIPASMGVYLKNLSYLGLDNNMLEGSVPKEFGLLEFAGEINLENNNLSGRVPFTIKDGVGVNLRLAGNRGLCLDNRFLCSEDYVGGSFLSQMKPNRTRENNDDLVAGDVLFNGVSSMVLHFDPLMLVMSLWLLFFVFMGF